MVPKPVVISWATAVVAPRFIEGAIDRARGRPGIKLTERDKGAAAPFTSRLREHYEECDTPVA